MLYGFASTFEFFYEIWGDNSFMYRHIIKILILKPPQHKPWSFKYSLNSMYLI